MGIRPSYRVNRAMKRLSRDKWLSPDEVSRIGLSLAKCAAPAGYGMVLKHSYAAECEIVGMINGFPPAFHFDRNYHFVLATVRSILKRKDPVPEIALLSTLKYR